jgi:hypothetical protein
MSGICAIPRLLFPSFIRFSKKTELCKVIFRGYFYKYPLTNFDTDAKIKGRKDFFKSVQRCRQGSPYSSSLSFTLPFSLKAAGFFIERDL